MATRSNPKAPSFTKTQLAKAIKDDDSKRAAKRASKRASKAAKDDAEVALQKAAADLAVAEKQAKRDKDAEQLAYAAALRVDAEAMGHTTEEAIAAYIAEQMAPSPEGDGKPKREPTYFGPMLALRAAAKHYVKAKNGILCNGDWLAQAVGHLDREAVCVALIEAMKLPGNPYTHLNPGQQSMNLRNKARQALKAGTLTMAEVRAAAKTPADAIPPVTGFFTPGDEEGDEDGSDE